MPTLSVRDAIGGGYDEIWFTNCHARYRALKGGRNTKKSTDILGIEPLIKILTDPWRNVIMIRQNDVDNGDSTFGNLVQWMQELGLADLFRVTVSPYRITRKATGQVIVFRGMNNPTGITSIKPRRGVFTDVYFEEASELRSYEDFRKVDGSIRGDVPDGGFLQITFCFNAWDVGHWLYDVFFRGNLEDDPAELEDKGYQFAEFPDFNLGFGKGLALHISSYRVNEFRAPDYDESMAVLKSKAYDIYLVEGLGCWGNTADRTYPHWGENLVVPEQEVNRMAFDCVTIGIDTGLSDGEGKIKYTADGGKRLGSAMTMQLFGMTGGYDKMVAIDEYFDSNVGRRPEDRKTEPAYMAEMLEKIREWEDTYSLWDRTVCAYVDCADVGYRDSLEALAPDYGLDNVVFVASTKLRILTRVTFSNLMMAMGDLAVSSRCANLAREMRNSRKAQDGRCREDFDDHAINAWEYAWAPVSGRIRRWKTFKER